MIVHDGLQTGTRYYWKRSNGWDWTNPGGSVTRHWWEYFIEPTGLNGAGGMWVLEWMKWNTSGFEWKPQSRSLSLEESLEVVDQIRRHQAEALRGNL